jgi:SAM-dependent methyltransferase
MKIIFWMKVSEMTTGSIVEVQPAQQEPVKNKLRGCMLCGEKSYKHLYTKNGFEVLQCRKCSLVSTSIPEGFDVLRIYDQGYFEGGQADGYADYLGSKDVLRREFRKTVLLIRDLTNFRSPLRLLEVGCAHGFFLDVAAQYFDCVGIEASKEAAKHAAESGHTVYCGTVTSDVLEGIGNVDIVVMLDVIEHLSDPFETIRLLHRFLNEDGLLVIVTGDIESLLSKLLGKRWRLMTPPQHTYFFSARTLQNLLERLCFKCIRIDRPWKLVPVGLALYQISSQFGLRLRSVEWLSNVGMSINLFDTVRLAARKVTVK